MVFWHEGIPGFDSLERCGRRGVLRYCSCSIRGIEGMHRCSMFESPCRSLLI
jgi:hypothetical protein